MTVRVVVSGTHGSGKSTLIGDFAMAHREWTILADPYEDIDAAGETPGADEAPELRDAMDLALLDLVDDPELVGRARVVEITGNGAQRLARLEAAIGQLGGG